MGNQNPQITLRMDTGRIISFREQKMENPCKVTDAENSKVKANSTSQNTVTEFLSEKELEEVPPIPNTSVQFLVAWKKVRTNPQLRYLYLKVCYY